MVSNVCELSKRCTYSHVVGVRLRAHLTHERGGSELDEVGDGVGAELVLKLVLAFVEFLVEDDGRRFDALLLGEIGI